MNSCRFLISILIENIKQIQNKKKHLKKAENSLKLWGVIQRETEIFNACVFVDTVLYLSVTLPETNISRPWWFGWLEYDPASFLGSSIFRGYVSLREGTSFCIELTYPASVLRIDLPRQFVTEVLSLHVGMCIKCSVVNWWLYSYQISKQ